MKVEPSSQEKNDGWRSRNWRHELHVNFRGEREKPLPTKKSDEKKAYFLKWRRFVNWKTWLRRKRLESKQEATKTETTSERRAAAALAEREKWRKHEWRRVQGLEGKLKTIVSDATNTTSRKEQKILLKREQGWIIA